MKEVLLVSTLKRGHITFTLTRIDDNKTQVSLMSERAVLENKEHMVPIQAFTDAMQKSGFALVDRQFGIDE